MSDNPEPLESTGDSDLEGLLQQMSLRPPSAELDSRIATVCHPRRRSRRIRLAAAVAASVALVVSSSSLRHFLMGRTGRQQQIVRTVPAVAPSSVPLAVTPPAPTASSTAPAAAVSLVRTYGGITRDGMIGTLPDGQPMQRFRRQTVRQLFLLNPASGARISISIPREEIYVVPIRAF